VSEAEIRAWLVAEIARTVRLDPSEIDIREPFDAYGLASADAVGLSGTLEQLLGRELSPTLIYDYPSIAALSRHLGGAPAEKSTGSAAGGAGVPSAGPHEPIAIVGMGCRFPGAENPEAFWRLLKDGADMIREVPPDRWEVGAFFDPDAAVPGKAISRWGGFLDQVDRFDPFFFGISPGEAEGMDPQQRLLLEVAYEAFEDAGYSMRRLAGSHTAVFVGISVNEYGFLQVGRHELINGHSGTGAALSVAANRISYSLDLHGPSVAVDTACSSSLTAVHLACQSLRSGESELALAGGVNVVLSPEHSIAFTKAGVLAPDGRCKPFDAGANGYVRGEGCGLVVLKPLARALADSDPVYAVIRGGAVRQDGRTNGLMAPNREAQEAVLRAAYEDAGVAPGRVQYVEAHGTGTLLGDAIEAQALGAVLSSGRADGPCALGSVKSNFGHLEAAAGIAGLIKTALSLKHRTLTPTLHFTRPNPHIRFDRLNLRVQQTVAAWPQHDGTAIAGVSSFGFGGTNAHLVLEEAPMADGTAEAGPLPAQLLPLSGHNDDALREVAVRFRDRVTREPSNAGVSLGDLCASAGIRRNHLSRRVAVIARSNAELAERLEDFLRGTDHPDTIVGGNTVPEDSRLVLVFSGQGSQWPGMGRRLAVEEPAFGAALERCDAALRPHLTWSVQEELAAVGESARLDDIEVVQPVLFALQVALAALWRSFGVEPDAVVGHSMGEVAAAHVAGALSLEDAARIITARSRLLAQLSGHGGMAVVGLSLPETASFIATVDGGLWIAATNGPSSTVVAGGTAELTRLIEKLEGQGIFCRLAKVGVAAHGAQAMPLAEELRRCLEGLEPPSATLPFISSVTGGDATGMLLDGDYWARNLTEPVNFAGAVGHLLHSGYRTFIEVSPHPVLQSSIQQGMMQFAYDGLALPSLRSGEDGRTSLLRSLAALHVSGRDIAWRGLSRHRRFVSLPTYPWQRERFWIQAPAKPGRPRTSGSEAGRGQSHPLLGEPVALAHQPGAYLWQPALDAGREALLRDHRVNGEIVVPAAAYLEMALSAAAEAGIADTHLLRDLSFTRAMTLGESQRRTLQVTLFPAEHGSLSFAVYSRPAGEPPGDWTLHAQATFVTADAETDSWSPVSAPPSTLQEQFPEQIPPEELYRSLRSRGLEYGPGMRSIVEIRRSGSGALGRIVLPDSLRAASKHYRIHPALLDGALQAVAAIGVLPGEPEAADTFVPIGCRSVALRGSGAERLWSRVVLKSGSGTGAGEIECDVELLDESGMILGQLDGFRLARISRSRSPIPPLPRDIWLYGVDWIPVLWPAPQNEEGPAGGARGRWIVVGDDSGLALDLKRQFEARGDNCRIIAPDQPLGGEPSPVRGVIYLASPSGDDPTTQCNGLAGLVRSLTAASAPLSTFRLWVVTQGAQSVRPGDAVSVGLAPLWGLGKTIAFELPVLRCTLVDLDPSLPSLSASELLLRELSCADLEDQVALRGNERLVARLLPQALEASLPSCHLGGSPLVGPDGTYLITGGLGGLGLTVAQWMIEQGARHLVLVGRNSPSPAVASALATMRHSGAKVVVLAADVARAVDVTGIFDHIRETMPPLHGVVHAAGVLANRPVTDIDAESLARVMAPKVAGAWNLHLASRGEALDFFVLFSSAVSVLGSPGQGSYAAANSYLDALAHHRHTEGLPAISINWGPWSEVGLVSGGNFIGSRGNPGDRGVKGIDPESGVLVLGRAMMSRLPQLTVLPFDLRSLLDLYPAAARIPLFAEVGGRETHVARLYARPSLRQDYLAPRTTVERKLAELWRQTLRINRVGVRDSFFELGGDSVLAAQIITSAHRTFGVGIDLREAFQSFTIESLAKRIETAQAAPADGAPLERMAAGPGPLSFVQERQLFLELLDPFTAVNNLAVCLLLEGALEPAMLEGAANRVIARHEVLRTSFDTGHGRPMPRIEPALTMALEVVDLTHHPADRRAEALRLAELDARRPFELDHPPLLRARLFRLAPESHVLVIVVHHTIADGWSLGVLLRELFFRYRALATGTTGELPPLPIQYRDFASWQRDPEQARIFERQLEYWKKQLGGELPVLDLPVDRPRPTRQTFTGATRRFRISASLGRALKERSSQYDATPFMLLVAAFQALLHRYCRQDDILIGTPIAGRSRPETDQLIGPFINTLVLRTDLSGDPSFRELLNRVRQVALIAYANEDLPFERLVAELRPQRDLSRTPVFQAMVVFQNSPLPDLSTPGLSIELLPLDRGAAEFDLTMTVSEAREGFEFAFEYNSDLFDRPTIERLGGAFQLLLSEAVARPETRVSALPVMTETERRHLVVQLNETRAEYPRTECLHQLFEAQAARTPDSVAVICEGVRLSYRELDRRTTALATALQHRGIGPDVTVGVCLPRSPDLLVSLLAVLKAGGAYVPIDPTTPADRIRCIQEDAGAKLLLTRERVEQLLAPPIGPGALRRTSVPTHLAYVIYTSGSTGRPKGVRISHSSLVNLFWSLGTSLGLGAGDQLLAVTSVSFDIAALELFLPLLVGATVVLATDDMTRDRRRLQEAIEAHGVKVMQATPSLWRLMLQGGWRGAPGLLALSGGEPLTPELAEQLGSRVGSLWNLYGPTETTIWSAAGRVTPGRGPITIGRPIANTQLYILDPQLQPVPTGAIGELHIGGDGVAQGYQNLPELTAEKFIPVPPGLPAPTGARLFKTGDRARYLPDAEIEVLGRFDQQIKLHGFRIEPGDIESALCRHPGVREAAVIPRTGPSGDAHLVAYVVSDRDPAPGRTELRDFLRSLLPAYLVPSVFVSLPRLPLTTAGKVNRRALPEPPSVTDAPAFAPPGTPLEELLATIYAQVLGVERIGIHDNFFDLGGGSIQILEIVVRAQSAGLTLAPESFFEHQTVSELASYCGLRGGTADD
jgi:amino acid adenylation domain-containing protein